MASCYSKLYTEDIFTRLIWRTLFMTCFVWYMSPDSHMKLIGKYFRVLIQVIVSVVERQTFNKISSTIPITLVEIHLIKIKKCIIQLNWGTLPSYRVEHSPSHDFWLDQTTSSVVFRVTSKEWSTRVVDLKLEWTLCFSWWRSEEWCWFDWRFDEL